MIILFILLAAICLRLILINQSLWLDEAINVLAVKNYSLIAIITDYAKYDFHPPGYSAILWIWTKIFGYSEIAVRLPSLIFGVLTVFLTYKIGKLLFNKYEYGVIAALLLTLNPLHIYYSQEARMYSFAAFTVALNIYLLLKMLRGRKILFIFILLSNLLVLASDYLAYFIFPSQLLILVLQKNLKQIKYWALAFISSLLIFSIWFPIFFEQFQIGRQTALDVPGWNMVVGEFGIKSLVLTFVKFIIGRVNFPDQLSYALLFIPIVILFAFLLVKSYFSLSKLSKAYLYSWFLFPVVSGWVLSIFISVFSYFRFLFVLPGFLLIVSAGILSFKSKLKFLLIILIIIIEIIFTMLYFSNPDYQRENWKGAVDYLRSVQRSNSIVLFESNGGFAPFDYYDVDKQIKAQGGLKNFPAYKESDLADLKDILLSISDIYLLNYLVDISDPNRLLEKDILELGYSKKDTLNFPNLGFIFHYVKN